MRSSRSAPDPCAPDPLGPGAKGFAHRGLHRPGVPENSLAACAAALEIGAGIECDLRLSADGAVMLFHDPDLARLCAAPFVFESRSRADLARHRLLATDQPIPRLTDLLDLVDGAVPLLLELKTCANVAALTAAVAADLTAYRGAAAIMSFDPRVGAWLARHRSDLRRGLVLSGRDSAVRRWFKLLLARPHFLAVNAGALTQPWAIRARRKMPLYTWTVRDPATRKTASVHADALIWEADGRP